MGKDRERLDKSEMDKITVPYIVYEGEQARNERHVRRLVIALVICIILIFASNVIWLYAWYQYDYTSTETVDIDSGEGIANYIGRDGDITNGEDQSN